MRSSKIPKNLDELENIILKNRSITNKKAFLQVKSPLKLTLKEVGLDEQEYKKAIEKIKFAKKHAQKIMIFGDYDADGISATAILWRVLFDYGCDVTPFIPERNKHGYGISVTVLKEIEKTVGLPDLMITVDNGIVAHEAFEFLSKKGVDSILTDHHQLETKADKIILPKAGVVVHTTSLCGATVSWMLARGVSKDMASRELDLCAIATIADQMPLLGSNRSFAVFGLEALRANKRPGLKYLFEKSGVKAKEITADTIGFVIAPKINAMGRLAHAVEALRLLCTPNTVRAKELSELLVATNQQRQELTSELFDKALKEAKKQVERGERIVIVSSPDFHEGVVGLIAGRLVEELTRPAIILSVNSEVSKASARSLPGVNIVEMIREVRADLLEVGGHPMAAGFGLETKKLEAVKAKLFKLAKERVDNTQIEPVLNLDCKLGVNLMTREAYLKLKELEPFGQNNPKPLFWFEKVRVVSSESVGNGAKHLKLTLEVGGDGSGKSLSKLRVVALWWRMGEKVGDFGEGSLVDLAGELDLNIWNGREKVQVIVRDVIGSGGG